MDACHSSGIESAAFDDGPGPHQSVIALSGGSRVYPRINPEATLALLVYYLGFGALSLGFGVLYVWAAELFPTTIRVRCMSVQSLAARFGAIASPFINDLGTTHPALSLMIFAAPCVIAGWATRYAATPPQCRLRSCLFLRVSGG